jgi:hypothetical protein
VLYKPRLATFNFNFNFKAKNTPSVASFCDAIFMTLTSTLYEDLRMYVKRLNYVACRVMDNTTVTQWHFLQTTYDGHSTIYQFPQPYSTEQRHSESRFGTWQRKMAVIRKALP